MTHTHRKQVFAAIAASLAAAFSLSPRADANDRRLLDLNARVQELQALAQGIVDNANRDNSRELSQDEKKQANEYLDEVDSLLKEIDICERMVALAQRSQQSAGRQVPAGSAEPVAAPLAQSDDEPPVEPVRPQASGNGIQTRGLSQPHHRVPAGTFGFRSLGEFAQRVMSAQVRNDVDARLRAATLSTYGNEGVGADGGFAVPPEFRRNIVNMVFGEASLFSRTDNSPTDSNVVTVPVDETTPWGTSGVRVYTRGEAQAMTQSKMKLQDKTVKLNEIYTFVPVTDELLEDAPLLTNHLSTKAGDALQFALTNYIINGTGVGQPLGILNAGGLVSVAAEGSQTAATIHALNIMKMWSRMPAAARANAVWLCNQDAETELMRLGVTTTSPSGTAIGSQAIFMPPGGLSGQPYATLLGKPVITTEACSALGTVGDIIFAYMPGYFAPYKASGLKSDVSIHLFFDQGVTAFRWTMRVGGEPWLSAPITRKNGSNTLAHFVTLAAR